MLNYRSWSAGPDLLTSAASIGAHLPVAAAAMLLVVGGRVVVDTGMLGIPDGEGRAVVEVPIVDAADATFPTLVQSPARVRRVGKSVGSAVDAHLTQAVW